jgi:uncharacterized damage-inducible protein DinB
MYTSAALLDIHQRTHSSLAKLMTHCAGFSQAELTRELDGFGYPTILRQLDHVIGGEEYWIRVPCGLPLELDRDENQLSLAALQADRERVAGITAQYLRGASNEELNTRRKMTTWGGHERELVPALIVLRTQTHIFDHKGQVAAMCRLLGKAIPQGFDFPLL